MPNDLNSYITKRLISNLVEKYKSEINHGMPIESIKRELLIHDFQIREEVLKELSKYTQEKTKNDSQNQDNNNKQTLQNRESI